MLVMLREAVFRVAGFLFRTVVCSKFVQQRNRVRILHLIRSATGPFCSLFVQQMRSFSTPESVHQTQVFSVLLAFLSLVNGWADRTWPESRCAAETEKRRTKAIAQSHELTLRSVPE